MTECIELFDILKVYTKFLQVEYKLKTAGMSI